MTKIVIAYVPVLHEGYYQFFSTHKDAKAAYILDKSLIQEFDWLRKELRALPPELIVAAIRAWKLIPDVTLMSVGQLENISRDNEIIMPDEDVSHSLAETFLDGRLVQFDPIFLRWDRRRSEAQDAVEADVTISESDLDKRLMLEAHNQTAHSSDIYRRVGGLIAKNGQIWRATTNRAQPTDTTPWAEGDPRGNYNKGVAIETSVFFHAEAALIAEAAKAGESLQGADMYATVFPCPPCAMLVANSGIKRLFFATGYSVLHGTDVLKANGIELIKVNVELPPDRADVYRSYPEKQA